MQSLESTQYQAALAVLGAWKGASKISMYEELGWESLSDRRWFRRLCQFYNIQNDLNPLYLKEAIPQPRTFLHGQRRENVLHEIPCRTTRFFNSFYPDTTRSWNNIGFELTISIFKQKLVSLVRPPKKSIFGIHDPTGIRIHFQFRVGLSFLKGHKNHNFLDTHFFTKYALYTVSRKCLLRSISNILIQTDLQHLSPTELTQLYLYGHSNLTTSVNRLVN